MKPPVTLQKTLAKFAAVASLGAATLTSGCSRAVRLPEYGRVPAFTLTAQDGNNFDSNSIKGKIWLADFIFTSCPGPCPRMTSRMHQVQQAIPDAADVRFVSFTVDPEHDTPKQLSTYAAAFHAPPEQWFFLTGPQQELDHLGFDVFKLNHVDSAFMHSTRFVLIDRRSTIRQYYDTGESKLISRIVADIRRLEREAR